jgi:sterol desaturase/sphingolipid hydroxylase (fatty acid hydroxylase superfamily)
MAVDYSSTGSVLSMTGLPISFVIAFGHVLLKPRRGRTRWRTAWRVMLPPKIWLHPSTLLDFQYVLVGSVGFSVLFGYTLLTGYGVSHGVCAGLTQLFGPRETPPELPLYAKGLIILGLYLTIEFAYWIDHFLSHKIAFLWEFHKVHHSATVLTPFANWRVHPVDTIVYINTLALLGGSASGLIQYFAGEAFSLTSTAITGTLVGIYMALWGHLQHSQFWISCTGLAARIFLSPAHHQIHHSRNPIHFDKNFGASLAVWDWLFRTLHLPQRRNEHLRFGTEGDAHLKGLIPSVLYPFYYAVKRLPLPRAKSPNEIAHPHADARPAASDLAIAATDK